MNILIFTTQIKYETDKAILVGFPKSSDMKAYSFWFPKSLVSRYKKSLDLYIPKGFVITAKAKSKALPDMDFEGDEIADYFTVRDTSSYVEVAEPEKLEIEKVEVEESLKR